MARGELGDGQAFLIAPDYAAGKEATAGFRETFEAAGGLALVTGSLRPSAGRVVLDGQDVTRRPDHARARAGMGKTFQHSSLFPSLPVLDNVALATQ